jgi:hypothetical protein
MAVCVHRGLQFIALASFTRVVTLPRHRSRARTGVVSGCQLTMSIGASPI